jgi:hypothetical protein
VPLDGKLNSSSVVVGKMSFDRETNSWRASQCSEKGSDSLEEYNGLQRKRPALIAPLSTQSTLLPRVENGMVFDPVKMCWRGNNEDALVFSDEDSFEKEYSFVPCLVFIFFSGKFL